MNDIQKLRYWTFKILPLVYDDSLSYYEVLAKITSKINELVQYNNSLNANIAQTVIDQVKAELDSDELATKVFDTLAGAIATDEGDTTYTPNNKTGGELVWINGTLYKVTKNMVTGELYTIGTNIETVKIADELAVVKKYLTGTHNQYWNTQASESYDTGVYLFWKDTLYKTTKDIALNDILATDGNGTNLTEVDLGTEITDHYFEMKNADENLQTQIDNNENDIETKVANLQTNLQRQINNIPINNTSITGRKFVFVGDSYASSYYSNWMGYLKQFLGIDSYIDAHADGYAFRGGSLLAKLQEITATLTEDEKNAITDFVCLGGINDCDPIAGDNLTSIVYNAIADYVAYVNTNYPNATLSFGFIGNVDGELDPTGRTFPYQLLALQAWTRVGNFKHCRYIDNIQYIMHNYGLMRDDHIHPTLEGGERIAQQAASALLGGTTSVIFGYAGDINNFFLNNTYDSKITGYNLSGQASLVMYNEMWSFATNNDLIWSMVFNNDTEVVTLEPENYILIGTSNQGTVHGQGYYECPVTVRFYNSTVATASNDYTYVLECSLKLFHNQFQLWLPRNAIPVTQSSISFTQLYIERPFTYTMPTLAE